MNGIYTIPKMNTKCRQKSHVIMWLQNVDILDLTLKDDEIKLSIKIQNSFVFGK